jgi:NitT/TauT family transport system substrate-binding protein
MTSTPTPARASAARRHLLAGAAAAAGLLGAPASLRGATAPLRIAEQFGIAYLPLHVARERGLIEAHARRGGEDVTVEWAKLSGGAAINDAILSNSVDIASGGIGPLLTIWDRTRGGLDVRAVAMLAELPFLLTARRPGVTSIRDLGPKDRIALPTVGVSVQARILQLAAEQTFGQGQHGRLDPLTVTMPHPEATAAMITGATEITAHFTSPPFQNQQLKVPGIRAILSSYDVLGGPASSVAMWARAAFRAERPAVHAAFLAAVEEANGIIAADLTAAAETYVRVERSRLDPAFVREIIADPAVRFTLVPRGTERLAEFMHRVGAIRTRPASWRDYVFDELHATAGN